eukprot:CAMPEP_0194134832 /NCGR_PEP_ID=MMETSP0152-20130528/4904_1 /TAXON_ID=1049557 /ORGANISM="Thalassiothrix antarctica, Strain L6-D1" /LENGTH=45 /DNA_ID= /DNA_START= /DNA_END= /DNA_ORIENTATION=
MEGDSRCTAKPPMDVPGDITPPDNVRYTTSVDRSKAMSMSHVSTW